jgi:hypothetical protein
MNQVGILRMKLVLRSRSLFFFVSCIMLDLPVTKTQSASEQPLEVEPLQTGSPPRKPAMSETNRPRRAQQPIQQWKGGAAGSSV